MIFPKGKVVQPEYTKGDRIGGVVEWAWDKWGKGYGHGTTFTQNLLLLLRQKGAAFSTQ